MLCLIFFRFSLSLVIFLYCLIYPIYFEISNNRYSIAKESEYYATLKNKEKDDIVGVNRKMDYLAEVVINTVGSKNLKDLRLLIWFFAGPLISGFVLLLTRRNIYSFIVFSKEDERYRKEKIRREKRSILILIASFLLSVISGIIGNYGFAWLTK